MTINNRLRQIYFNVSDFDLLGHLHCGMKGLCVVNAVIMHSSPLLFCYCIRKFSIFTQYIDGNYVKIYQKCLVAFGRTWFWIRFSKGHRVQFDIWTRVETPSPESRPSKSKNKRNDTCSWTGTKEWWLRVSLYASVISVLLSFYYNSSASVQVSGCLYVRNFTYPLKDLCASPHRLI